MTVFAKLADWFNGRPVVRPRYTIRVDVNPPSGGNDTAMIQEKIDTAVFAGAMLGANTEVHFPAGPPWQMGRNRHLNGKGVTLAGAMLYSAAGDVDEEYKGGGLPYDV